MKKRQKIAIIGATEFQDPLIRKAQELGFETYVYAWKSDDIGEKTADHFIPISVIEKEKIYKDCLARGIDTAVSIGSDITILTTNYLQRKFHKPTNPVIVDTIGTNKFRMRTAFMKAGVLCPKYLKARKVPEESELSGFSYPLIVKPVDRSGSRGIYKVRNYKQLSAAFLSSASESFSKYAIIEEFIEGKEYSAESISYKGKHILLALTKKHTTGSPHFIETGHDEPSGIDEKLIPSIEKEIYKALDALHFKNGASHTEFKIDENGKFHVIEIGPRMGGDCIGSDLVYLSTGYDFMKMVIDIADGKTPDFVIHDHYKEAHIRFIFSEKDLLKLGEIKKNPRYTMTRTNIKNNTDLTVTNSTDRHGYYLYVKNQ